LCDLPKSALFDAWLWHVLHCWAVLRRLISPKRRHLQSFRLLALASMLLPRPVVAEPSGASDPSLTRAACALAFEDAQRLRNAARYLDANREVLKCTNPSCGAALSEECGKIHGELQAATPSVVFAVRDNTGGELASASVKIDSDGSAPSLDGKPVPIDPGSHTFTFHADGFEPQAQSVVIRAGERFRPITIVLQPLSTNPARAPSPNAFEPTLSSNDTSRAAVPLPVYVLGGVAAVGVAGFVGFRWWGSRDFDELSRGCKPDCSSSSVDAVRQKYAISTVSLAVGGAATAAAITWYFAAKPSASSNSARLQIWSSADGASARFSTRF
jgi:hypothetical protein